LEDPIHSRKHAGRRAPPDFEGCQLSHVVGLDAVRLWLLENLHHPFPTSGQKQHLSDITKRAKNNIETDLTNYRRRSGWTEFKNNHCNGNLEKTKSLIWSWMSGERVSDAVRKDLEEMKAYVERKEATKVGDWIDTVRLGLSHLTVYAHLLYCLAR
jgi:hypothetical protein